MLKFSIITPSLNQVAYLPECVESVRGQILEKAEKLKTETLKRGEGGEVPPSLFQCSSVSDFSVEHLVQDGVSTDGTVAWLEENTKKRETPCVERGRDSGLLRDHPTSIVMDRYEFRFVSEPDGGQTDAINRGFAAAKGDLLSYLCADDYLQPCALGRVAEVFQSNPEVDVVYGDFAFLEGDSGWVRRKRTGPFSVARLLRDNFVSQPATFIRRRVYEHFGPLDSALRYCMDHEYWLRIARDTRWFYLAEVLAVQRLHADSKTGSQLVRAWNETAEMTERYGMGELFRARARWMRLCGARLYSLRRRIGACVGRWMR